MGFAKVWYVFHSGGCIPVKTTASRMYSTLNIWMITRTVGEKSFMKKYYLSTNVSSRHTKCSYRFIKLFKNAVCQWFSPKACHEGFNSNYNRASPINYGNRPWSEFGHIIAKSTNTLRLSTQVTFPTKRVLKTEFCSVTELLQEILNEELPRPFENVSLKMALWAQRFLKLTGSIAERGIYQRQTNSKAVVLESRSRDIRGGGQP